MGMFHVKHRVKMYNKASEVEKLIYNKCESLSNKLTSRIDDLAQRGVEVKLDKINNIEQRLKFLIQDMNESKKDFKLQIESNENIFEEYIFLQKEMKMKIENLIESKELIEQEIKNNKDSLKESIDAFNVRTETLRKESDQRTEALRKESDQKIERARQDARQDVQEARSNGNKIVIAIIIVGILNVVTPYLVSLFK